MHFYKIPDFDSGKSKLNAPWNISVSKLKLLLTKYRGMTTAYLIVLEDCSDLLKDCDGRILVAQMARSAKKPTFFRFCRVPSSLIVLILYSLPIDCFAPYYKQSAWTIPRNIHLFELNFYLRKNSVFLFYITMEKKYMCIYQMWHTKTDDHIFVNKFHISFDILIYQIFLKVCQNC